MSAVQEFKRDNIVVMKSDIAKLAHRVDVVVNASNPDIKMGGGVAGAIHTKFGDYLEEMTENIDSMSTGSCILTKPLQLLEDGDLPANQCNVIHTLAPRQGHPDWMFLLERCYQGALELVKRHNFGGPYGEPYVQDTRQLKKIAFPMLGTGAYGLASEQADSICVTTVSEWIDQNYPDGGLTAYLVVGPYANDADERVLELARRATRLGQED